MPSSRSTGDEQPGAAKRRHLSYPRLISSFTVRLRVLCPEPEGFRTCARFIGLSEKHMTRFGVLLKTTGGPNFRASFFNTWLHSIVYL